MEEKILEILKDYKNKPNKDLIFVMNFLSKEFDDTKEVIIQLTKK